MSKKSNLAFLAVAALLFSACSSGGNSGTETEESNAQEAPETAEEVAPPGVESSVLELPQELIESDELIEIDDFCDGIQVAVGDTTICSLAFDDDGRVLALDPITDLSRSTSLPVGGGASLYSVFEILPTIDGVPLYAPGPETAFLAPGCRQYSNIYSASNGQYTEVRNSYGRVPDQITQGEFDFAASLLNNSVASQVFVNKAGFVIIFSQSYNMGRGLDTVIREYESSGICSI